MDPERWRELQDLLQAAWSLAPENRAAYLEGHCDDPELRGKAQALLTADEEAERYFDRLASDAGVTGDEESELVDPLAQGQRRCWRGTDVKNDCGRFDSG